MCYTSYICYIYYLLYYIYYIILLCVIHLTYTLEGFSGISLENWNLRIVSKLVQGIYIKEERQG